MNEESMNVTEVTEPMDVSEFGELEHKMSSSTYNGDVHFDEDKENRAANPRISNSQGDPNVVVYGKEEIETHHQDAITAPITVDLDKYMALCDVELPPKYEQAIYSTSSEDRLIISYIELENFKSYYGVNKMGPFGKNFSCVVGPNGSGKSNIFDCMLFVFDYNVKKCRTKKLSELIHRSADRVCDFARVSIYFKRVGKKDGKDFEIDGSSFCVTRRIRSDNKSSFFINDKKVSREELKETLKCHGLGLDHDRFLILQGEVESISLLKPKAEDENEDSMLTLVDDIIGTSRYKIPLEEINHGICELQRKIAIINSKLKESERFRNLLEEKTRSCIEQNRIKNGITDLKYQRFLILAEKCRSRCVEIQNQLSEYQAIVDKRGKEVRELEENLKVYESQREEAKNAYRECRNQDEAIQTSLSSNSTRLEEIRRSHLKYEARVKAKEEKIDAISQEILKLGNTPLSITAKIQGIENELEGILEIEKELCSKKEEAEEIFERERSEYASEYDTKQSDVVHFKNKVSELKNEKSKLEFKLSQVTNEKDNIEREIGSTEAFIAELSLSNKSNLEKRATMLKNMSAIEEELVDLRERSKMHQNKIRKYESDISDESEKCNALRQQYNSLTDREEHRPSSAVYKFLIDLNYQGFRGRLGDLAAIDKKYDTALSTLGGRSLDMFVVETTEDAQYLVNQLKDSRKGRASFMSIEEMRKKCGDGDRKKIHYEGAVRAIDMLKDVPPELKPCFDYVFRDSLIVEKMDDAKFLREKYNGNIPKIVTLDGSEYERQGKVTGGGEPISGLIGEKTYLKPKADDRLKFEIKDKLNKSSQRITDLRTQYSQLLEEKHKIDILTKKKDLSIDELRKQISHIDGSVKNGNLCLNNKKRVLSELREQLSNVHVDEDEYNRIVKEIKSVETQIKSTERVLEKKTAEFETVKNEVDSLYKKWVEEHADNLEKCVARKEECKNSISNLQKKLNFTSKQTKAKEEELHRCEKELYELSSKIDELQNEEGSLMEKRDDLIKRRDENNRLLQICNERLNCHGEVSRLNNQIIELRNEIDKHQSLINVNNEKLGELSSKETMYKEKISSLKYIFYNSMNLLPEELTKFHNDEIYYIKRVHDAEKEFLNSLNNDNCEMEAQTSEVEIKSFEESELRTIMTKEEEIERKLRNFKSAYLDEADDGTLSRYLEKQEMFLSNLKEYNKVDKVYKQLKDKYDEWVVSRIKEFNEGFNVISKCVKEVYQNITFGGDAELEPCDKFDPYNFGINYKIRPPAKSWKKMTNLSGGEKTLASLALVFALHEYNPTPLYIMDEIDAALDFRNVAIIGEYIKKRTLNAQFIVISLRKEMYELADKCIEIWKLDDKTRSACSDMTEVYKANRNYVALDELYLDSNLKQNLSNLYSLLNF
uniref:Structural maintenance of chromosomes protein n=1 Tax=Strongyloides venezuelensis TaxID=75913 RepID=A0A0K0FU71_STRVS